MPDQRIFELTEQPTLDNDAWLIMDKSGWQTARKIAPSLIGGSGGGAPTDATYITQTPNGTLTNEQALSALATGLLKNTTGTGVLSVAAEGTDYSLLPVVDTIAVVKGSADGTKQFRIEVDGFTAGATRVGTPPNQDFTFAGLEVENIFTANQAIQRSFSGAETGTLFAITSVWNTTGVCNGLGFVITNTASNANSFLFSLVAKVGAADVASFVQRVNGRLEALSDSSSITNDGRSTDNRLILVNPNATVNNYSSVIFADNRNTEAAWIAARHIDHANDYADLFLGTRGADGAVIRLYITSAGDIGIGDKISAPAAKLEVTDTDAATATVVNAVVFGHDSSGTPAVGFGTGVLVEGESSTTAGQSMGRLTYEWSVATHATRKALGKLSAFDAATEREAIRWGVDGTNPTLGFLGATAIARPTAYTQTFSTADRTFAAYTSDPESGAYTGIDNAQAGTPYAQLTDLNALRVAYETLRVHAEDTAQLVNSILDDLQAYGLLA